MPRVILGLDIGGANLKAATSDKRAASVPFALWKEPDRLPAVLAELVGRFPDAEELAVTMTGELCDCFRTKRDGVNHILNAVESAAIGRRAYVWTTDGEYVPPGEARSNHMKAAAANWHALATFASRTAPTHHAMLIDIGSTTTDMIPIAYGVPNPSGLTDTERLQSGELLYRGVVRTPVCVLTRSVAAEFFATTRDVYIVLRQLPENASDQDTADGRPATYHHSLARLARMLGGDLETLTEAEVIEFAKRMRDCQLDELWDNTRYCGIYGGGGYSDLRTIIISGSGEFLARIMFDRWGHLLNQDPAPAIVSLSRELGPELSACAPAYAAAALAAERRP
jgi:probable H4MPT-linked C1 transfer pathway protein